MSDADLLARVRELLVDVTAHRACFCGSQPMVHPDDLRAALRRPR